MCVVMMFDCIFMFETSDGLNSQNFNLSWKVHKFDKYIVKIF